MSQIVFITGTDTGVGKTLLTALLLHHLRRAGRRALALKPFASGSLDDARLLNRVQDDSLPLAQVCPFFFRDPLAPAVAARRERRRVTLQAVVAAIRSVLPHCDTLLVEGCGGLLTPLGSGYSARELIAELGCRAVIVAPNRLGVLNQVGLVHEVLRRDGLATAGVVLMTPSQPDSSTRTNATWLREHLAPVPVVSLPHLGRHPGQPQFLRMASIRLRRTLAGLAAAGA